MDYPPELNVKAFEEFLEYRKTKKKKPVKDQKRLINKLVKFTHDEQQVAVTTAIDSEWQGVFPEKIYGEASPDLVGNDKVNFFFRNLCRLTESDFNYKYRDPKKLEEDKKAWGPKINSYSQRALEDGFRFAYNRLHEDPGYRKANIALYLRACPKPRADNFEDADYDHSPENMKRNKSFMAEMREKGVIK